jgi:TRAP-type C4-dicarboxylate transport system permease small subunit
MGQSEPTVFDKLKKWQGWLATFFTGLSALTVAAMVGLIVVSSLMRYVVGRPFHFTEELSALFFMTLTVLPLAYAAKIKSHIRIGIIFDHIPQPVRDWVALAAHVVTLIFVTLTVRITWGFAYMTHQFGGLSSDAGLVLFPWMALIPICLVVFGFQVIIDLVEQWQGIMKSRVGG